MVQIETERLTLSTWDDADLERFRPIATDPRVMRFITGGEPWPNQRIALFIRRNQEIFQEHGFCRWKLEEKSTGRMVGFCGPGFLAGLPDPEIGWWLAVDRWGLGLAPEAARAAFHHATNCRRVERLISIAHPDNGPSIRVMQKLGLRYQKSMEYNDQPVVVYNWESAPTPTP